MAALAAADGVHTTPYDTRPAICMVEYGVGSAVCDCGGVWLAHHKLSSSAIHTHPRVYRFETCVLEMHTGSWIPGQVTADPKYVPRARHFCVIEVIILVVPFQICDFPESDLRFHKV